MLAVEEPEIQNEKPKTGEDALPDDGPPTAAETVAVEVSPEESESEGADVQGDETVQELSPEEEERLIQLRVEDPARPDLKWYVIHTLTGHEEKVRTGILKSVEDRDMREFFDEVLVPTEEVTRTTKDGKKTLHKVFYPGYVLVRMKINEKSWALVLGTPGVTGFVKTGTYPVPLKPEEVRITLDQVEGRKPRIEYEVDFEPGENVKIVSGPFVNFTGVVEDVYPVRQKIKVLVTVLGRATSTELEISQVEKVA